MRRVASIALVHETLSLALDESVAFDGIADRVLAMCAEVAAPEADVTIRRVGSAGDLPAEVATPLSMVLTELVQNAVEHAFPTGPGRIDVRLRAYGRRAVPAGRGRRPRAAGGLRPRGLDPARACRSCGPWWRASCGAASPSSHGPGGGTQAVLVVPLER